MNNKIKKQHKRVKTEYRKLKRINTRNRYLLPVFTVTAMLVLFLAVLYFARKYEHANKEFETKMKQMELKMDSVVNSHFMVLTDYENKFLNQQNELDQKVTGSLREMKAEAMKQAKTEAGIIVNKFLLENEQAYIKTKKNTEK